MEQQNATELENSKRETSTSQSSKLEVFEMSRKYFATMGFTPNLVHQTYPFNGSILLGFLALGSSICNAFVFIVHDAGTFAEYTNSVYTISAMTLIIVSLLILILKVEKLFELINRCDMLVNTSQ